MYTVFYSQGGQIDSLLPPPRIIVEKVPLRLILRL